MKQIFRVVLLSSFFTFIGCRTGVNSGSSKIKDVIEESNSIQSEPISIVTYSVVRIPRDIGSIPPDQLGPLFAAANASNIRQEFANILIEADNCIQIAKRGSGLFVEFYSQPCPKTGFLNDRNSRAFTLVVDSESEKSNRLILRKNGYAVGTLAVNRNSTNQTQYELEDLFCRSGYGNNGQPCDITLRDGRWRGLKVNMQYEETNPNYKVRYGWNSKNARFECKSGGGLQSSVGNTHWTACKKAGIDPMFCDDREDDVLCEAKL